MISAMVVWLVVKLVAYADDLFLVSGKYFSVVSKIMEGASGKACLWAARCGVSINPAKTELMLFTTRSRTLEFHLSWTGSGGALLLLVFWWRRDPLAILKSKIFSIYLTVADFR